MSKIAVIIDSSSAMPVAIRNRYHIFQVNDPLFLGTKSTRRLWIFIFWVNLLK